MPRKSAVDALTLFDSLVYTCRYRVSIDVPSDALAWVMQCRHALRERVGSFECFYQLPGITLLETELPPEYEGALSDSVQRGAQGQSAFQLRAFGVHHSMDRKTIYAAIDGPGALAIQRRIGDHVRANRKIRKLGVELPPPMLVIAGPLKAAQFDAAWAMLGAEGFNAERSVGDVTLLKRELADDSLDEHVRTFRFGGLS
ncbi:MAG: hypothetical protein JNM49_05835 [Flavobacteriales bacterium]|jgi:hypothetical protein|nr:hypothetical protein [Flavobacteriales bacterium]